MRGKQESDKVLYGLAALAGAIAFVMIYGINVLNPVYDDWLLGQGDLTQHYLGWCFFRRSDWSFPIGLTNNLAYPSYTSIIFTDSIPLLAVFFKALSPILPQTFQYFGWWGIVCFALQGFISAKILGEFSLGRIQILVGTYLLGGLSTRASSESDGIGECSFNLNVFLMKRDIPVSLMRFRCIMIVSTKVLPILDLGFARTEGWS